MQLFWSNGNTAAILYRNMLPIIKKLCFTYQICCGLFSCLALHRPVISRGGSRSCSTAAFDVGSLWDASGPEKCCVTGARQTRCARSSEHRIPRGAWGRNETRGQSSQSRERSCPPAHRLHPSPTLKDNRRKKSYRMEESPCGLSFPSVLRSHWLRLYSQCVFTSDYLSPSLSISHSLSLSV